MLVFLAVLISQAAGAWLDYIVRSGRPLLSKASRAEAPAVAALEPERMV